MTPEEARKLAETVSLDDLLVLGAIDLEEAGTALTFENLVAACFRLFPQRFSLRGYPEWPDSNVVNKSWLRARSDKHWLVGSVREGFRLTPEGRRHATQLVTGGGSKAPRPARADRRTREGRLLEAMKATDAFQQFVRDPDSVVLQQGDVADAMLAPEDTPVKTLLRSAAQFRAAATVYADRDALAFLEQVDNVLDGARTQNRAGYAGGMMQRKKKGGAE